MPRDIRLHLTGSLAAQQSGSSSGRLLDLRCNAAVCLSDEDSRHLEQHRTTTNGQTHPLTIVTYNSKHCIVPQADILNICRKLICADEYHRVQLE